MPSLPPEPSGPSESDASGHTDQLRRALLREKEARDPAPGVSLENQRNWLRSTFLRTTTQVGVMLAAVLLLTFAAVLSSLLAARNQERAETAELEGRERLWRSYLAQARAARFSGRTGRRAAATEAIRNAALIKPSIELRNEAIASHVLLDMEVDALLGKPPKLAGWGSLSPGLELYVTGGVTGEDIVYRTADNKELFRLDPLKVKLEPAEGRDRRMSSFIFSPDARYANTTLRDGAFVVWEMTHGQVVYSAVPKKPVVRTVEFSPVNSWILFADAESTNGLRITDLATGKDIQHRVKYTGTAYDFGPGSNEVSIAKGREISSYRMETGALVRTLTAPGPVVDFDWSPDSRKLAATGLGGEVYLWNLDTESFHALQSHPEHCWSIQFNRASDLLVTSSGDNQTRVWDVNLGHELLRSYNGIVQEFSRDGTRLGFLQRSGSIGTWRLAPVRSYSTLMGRGDRAYSIIRFDLSPDGKRMLAVERGGLQVWDFKSQQAASFFPLEDAYSAAFEPDDNSLLICRAGGLERRRLSGGTNNLPLKLGPAEPIAVAKGAYVRHVAVSRDGLNAVVDLEDRRLAILDLSGKRPFLFLEQPMEMLYGLGPAGATGSGRFAISPDGRWVAVGYGATNGPMVLDGRTGKIIKLLPGIGGTVAFSPDGQYLALSGNNDYTLLHCGDWQKVWERPVEPLPEGWGSMAFEQSGQWLAVANGPNTIDLLNPTNGVALASLAAPDPQSISGLRAAADGSRLVAPTRNNVIQVWDIPTLRRELVQLGLDWPDPPAVASKAPSALIWSPTTTACLGLATASLTALMAALVLKRHRRMAGEYVESEERWLRQKRELEVEREINKLKTSFVSMVSHEFRTPLAVIAVSSDILQAYSERLGADRRAEHLADIATATQRMSTLIEDVLFLAGVEAGRLVFKPTPLDLKAACARIVEETLSATNQRCPIAFESDGLEQKVQVDEGLLRHILLNVLSNAVKYSKEGSTVTFQAVRGDDALVFEIGDGGIGIPEAELGRLFQSFYRANNVGQIPGTGLGLVIVKRCVDIHQGTIQVKSLLGVGTTVTIRLPLLLE